MTCCAVMLVKDEADIIEYTVRHLLANVDHVIVSDNDSHDGTSLILGKLLAEQAALTVLHDPEVGYYQSAKTTELAQLAFARGVQWVLPCDADEYWFSPDGRRISDYLDGLAPDVQIVRAEFLNHVPTAEDDTDEGSPFKRIGWRKRQPQDLRFGKVCCRARPDLVIAMGNHSATTEGTALETVGLQVRHYSWRSEAQYVRKIRNGALAYKATEGLEDHGQHWRMWEEHSDEDIAAHFRRWFFSQDPNADASLFYDPVER